jgi:murein DD-endopeptidase MepM/ murein hydrolase activator NlpD
MTPTDRRRLLVRAAGLLAATTLVSSPVVSGTPQPARSTSGSTSQTAAPAIRPAVAGRRVAPVLRLQSRGAHVKWLQQKLRVAADGIFGPRTRAAVVAFQKRHRLATDGVAGPKTLAVLNRQPAKKKTTSCIVGGAHRFRDDWGNPRSGGRTHKGNDVFAAYGAPVHAIAAGVVVRSYESGLGGRSIILRVGRTHFYYAHNSVNMVRTGQQVAVGQVIARVGTSGNARGGPAHVHFERWDGPLATRRVVNPFATLSAVC